MEKTCVFSGTLDQCQDFVLANRFSTSLSEMEIRNGHVYAFVANKSNAEDMIDGMCAFIGELVSGRPIESTSIKLTKSDNETYEVIVRQDIK